ncbi:hypothetical protein Hanom_Chr03g00268691 [Helianthus anomalus]
MMEFEKWIIMKTDRIREKDYYFRDEEKHMRTLVKEDFGQPDRVNIMPCVQFSFKIYLQWRKDDNINLKVFHVTIFFLTSKNCVV